MRAFRNTAFGFLVGVIGPVASHAGMVITLEKAGQQTASPTITNQHVQTFENIQVGQYKQIDATVGSGASAFRASYTSDTKNGFFVKGADAYGSAGGTGNYFVVGLGGGSTSVSLNLSVAQAYFGFWWSAGDKQNQLAFYSGNTLINSFTTNSSFFTNLTSGYYGNPNRPSGSNNSGEPYAFINFFGTGGTKFDRIEFLNSTSTGFESDNHTFSADQQQIVGTTVGTPEPGTLVSACLAVMATGLWVRLVKRKVSS